MEPASDHDLLIRLDEKFDRVIHELFGNGQPGRLQVLEETVAEHRILAAGVGKREDDVSNLKKRVGEIEMTHSRNLGIASTVGAFFGAAVTAAVRYFWPHR